MNKLAKILIITIFSLALIVCLTACNSAQDEQGPQGEENIQEEQGEEEETVNVAYETYRDKYGYSGTEEEWLSDLEIGNLVKHTVTFIPDNNQDSFTQVLQYSEKATLPDAPEKIGYTLLGWYYTEGESDKEWSFIEDSVTEDITLVAKWDYATYELPIINIDTNGAEINSKEDYTTMTFSMENCDGELVDISGGIRLRGNSTMRLDKKPYRIKFDKKQSLFGLDKAKSWVLLAEYLDPSALHNYTAFSLASELDGLSFTPTPYKVNVYLNGKFIGLYTLCEQVQENEGRMDIEMEEINEAMVNLKDYNFFITMDKSVVDDKTAVLDETYFYIHEYDRYFELKYPEKDQFASEEQFNSFMTQLKAYTKEMLDVFTAKDLEKIQQEVNVGSLIDFLIVDIIMGDQDHSWKSFNMYYTNTSDNEAENGKLSFGPIWDYDWSLNTPWTGLPNECYEYSSRVRYSNRYYAAIQSIPELYNLLKARYNSVAKHVLGEYIEGLDALCASMEESVRLNHELWYKSISPDLSEKNIAFLKEYLEKRKAQLDELWRID